jgi:hypothetical protein
MCNSREQLQRWNLQLHDEIKVGGAFVDVFQGHNIGVLDSIENRPPQNNIKSFSNSKAPGHPTRFSKASLFLSPGGRFFNHESRAHSSSEPPRFRYSDPTHVWFLTPMWSSILAVVSVLRMDGRTTLVGNRWERGQSPSHPLLKEKPVSDPMEGSSQRPYEWIHSHLFLLYNPGKGSPLRCRSVVKYSW